MVGLEVGLWGYKLVMGLPVVLPVGLRGCQWCYRYVYVVTGVVLVQELPVQHFLVHGLYVQRFLIRLLLLKHNRSKLFIEEEETNFLR